MDNVDVFIAGAGIIGLSVALELAGRGYRVKVVERGLPMAESSWAAAGMLAAEDPENPPELAELAALSGRLYPAYLDRIRRLSGCDVGFRTRGTVQVSEPGSTFSCSETGTRIRIAKAEAERRIPGLKIGDRSLLWLEEASLDPRDLCSALPLAAVAAGVDLAQRTAALSVVHERGSVRIATSSGELSAGMFINCCGAWASTIRPSLAFGPGDSVATAPIVEPRKGQMAIVQTDGRNPLRHVIRAPEVYLVPRSDTKVAIGASVERVGFDKEIESSTIDELLGRAADLWPPIALAPLVECWAGLRPATKDTLPLIGSSGMPNCWLATGHFRNGILLAPATALVMRQLVERSATEVSLDPFSPERLSLAACLGKLK